MKVCLKGHILFFNAKQVSLWMISVLCVVSSYPARSEPGVTATSLTFGQSIYLTGGLASLGNDLNTGAKLYFDRINSQGGVNGRKLLLETIDDAYDPTRAKANALKLLDEQNVFALFQFAGTGSVAAVAPLADQRQTPLCAAVATGPELRAQRFDNVFYVRAGNEQEINVIARHLSTIGRKRIGVMYLDAPYGLQGRAVAVKAAQRNGLTYVGDDAIPATGTDEEATKRAALSMATKKPDGILLVTAGKATVAAVRALRRQGIRNDQMYALAAALSAGEIKALDQLARGLVVSQVIPNPASLSQPNTLAFRAAVVKAGFKPNYALLEGWINAAVCVSALEKAGPKPTRASFRKALESLDADFSGMRVHFDGRRRNGSDYVELTFVKEEGAYSK